MSFEKNTFRFYTGFKKRIKRREKNKEIQTSMQIKSYLELLNASH